jgi:archaellin
MKPVFVKMFLFFSLIAAVGCAPVYYKPNLMNVPNFCNKEEAFLVANLSDAGYELQAAYAVTDHIGVQVNYATFSSKKKSESTQNSTPQNVTTGLLAEGAIGYYKPFGEGFAFGIYGGYGVGSVQNNWNTQGSSSANLSKIFIQPTLGLKAKYFEWVISAKLANLTYSKLRHNYTNGEFINQFNVLRNSIPIWETAGIVRFGGKHVKLQLQTVIASTLNSTKPKFSMEGSSFGVGLCVQLNNQKGNGRFPSRYHAAPKPPKKGIK